jgi:hypothetical protein
MRQGQISEFRLPLPAGVQGGFRVRPGANIQIWPVSADADFKCDSVKKNTALCVRQL